MPAVEVAAFDSWLILLVRNVENYVLNHIFVVILGPILFWVCLYLGIILIAANSAESQKFMMYMYWHKWFSKPDQLTNLRDKGISSFTRNVSLTTEDGVKLNGYHMIPARHGCRVAKIRAGGGGKDSINKAVDAYFERLLGDCENVILYCHGIARDRAFHHRLSIMQFMANQFDAHVVAFDYRGFGDCEGQESLTERGTRLDAQAMDLWLEAAIERGCKGSLERPHKLCYGHSMGSSIATFLMAEDCGRSYSGLILNGAFTSGDDAMTEMKLAAPLRAIPFLFKYVLRSWRLVSSGYKTIEAIKRVPIDLPVLLLHGTADVTVPVRFGRTLYETWTALRNAAATTTASKKNRRGPAAIQFVELKGGLHSDNYHYSLWTTSIDSFLQRIHAAEEDDDNNMVH